MKKNASGSVGFILTGEEGERRRFVECLEQFCDQHAIPVEAHQAMDLALEEHLTNALSYGYEPEAPRHVAVKLGTDASWFWAEIRDDGKAFDPLSLPPVDVSVPLEEKPIGGLGVHLMREFMDELDYAREGTMNVLRMRKRLHPAAT